MGVNFLVVIMDSVAPGQAQRDFDSKQKRDDRKVVDYYTHLFGEAPKSSIAIAPKGQQSYYEIVVGIGDMNTSIFCSH